MGGGVKKTPLADYCTLILRDAPNGLIFHDFVPFNIRKVLGRPFLGFLFEISKKFYVDNFFHIQFPNINVIPLVERKDVSFILNIFPKNFWNK